MIRVDDRYDYHPEWKLKPCQMNVINNGAFGCARAGRTVAQARAEKIKKEGHGISVVHIYRKETKKCGKPSSTSSSQSAGSRSRARASSSPACSGSPAAKAGAKKCRPAGSTAKAGPKVVRIKPPKGYRMLREGEKILATDLVHASAHPPLFGPRRWRKQFGIYAESVGEPYNTAFDSPRCRRVKGGRA